MKDYLAFRRMLTPALIQVVFWIIALASVLLGIRSLLGAALIGETGPALGIALVVLGPLVARIWAEFTIVLFGIHSSLGEIHSDLRSQRQA